MLVAGFLWLYASEPDPKHDGGAGQAKLSRPRVGHPVHDAQPDRCHLSSAIVGMILVSYKFVVHPLRTSGIMPPRSLSGRIIDREFGPRPGTRQRQPQAFAWRSLVPTGLRSAALSSP